MIYQLICLMKIAVATNFIRGGRIENPALGNTLLSGLIKVKGEVYVQDEKGAEWLLVFIGFGGKWVCVMEEVINSNVWNWPILRIDISLDINHVCVLLKL